MRLALDTNRYVDLAAGDPAVVSLVERAEAVAVPFVVIAERQLRQQGTPVPTNDLWFAALTIQHELVLCTRDAHFRHLAQLDRVRLRATSCATAGCRAACR